MPKYLKVRTLRLSFLWLLFCVSCSETDEKSSSKTPIIKKKVSRLIAPKINQEYLLGQEMAFEVNLKDSTQTIDSVTLGFRKKEITFRSSSFEWSPAQLQVGMPKIKLTAYFNGKKETHYPKVKVLPEAQPVAFTYRLVNTYPHDPKAYTQGLFWHDDMLWESTGKEGASTLRKVDLQTGEIIKKIDLDPSLFGEGAVLHQGKIYQLTWTSQKGFIYDEDLQQIGEFRYPSEGWGITNFGDNLIMSNGTENLFIMEPEGFTEIDRLQVYNHQGKVSNLNELEFVEGKIYANVYGEEYIAVIDPVTGAVEATIDFSDIWPRDNTNSTMDYVLNGIAYSEDEDRLFITGKLWPSLYEVQLLQRGNLP